MEFQPQVIEELVQKIVKAVNPQRIILFGSAARGEFGSASDIDLLVVMPEGTHRRRTAQKLYRQIQGIEASFDILVATTGDIQRHKDNIGLIYRTVLKEGKELYAR
ncbi:MAG: nucleotidyltransferase domain-containing protein [Candidatus Neomarinimicrobiota bacterium]